MTLTSHLTHDMGVDPKLLSLDGLDDVLIHIPNDYTNVPYVD